MAKDDRLTPNQKGVLAAFRAAPGPLAAQDAWDASRAKKPRLGLATVYRAIGKLTEAGLLRPIDISEASQLYESTDKPHHHHFHCTICRKTFEIHACAKGLDGLVPPGFRMTDHSITIYGSCDACTRSLS